MLILDLWGISFHAVVVFGLGKSLLFKSILGRCVVRSHYESVKASWCVGLIDIGDIGIPFSTQNAPAENQTGRKKLSLAYSGAQFNPNQPHMKRDSLT